MPTTQQNERSSYRFLASVRLLLPSQLYSTAPPSFKRYDKRYEAEDPGRTSENTQNANFAKTEFYEVRELGVSRKVASKVSKTTHFGRCTAPRDAVTLGATTPVGKGGELDEGDRPRRVRLTRCPGTQGHRHPRDRPRRGTDSRARGRRGSGRLARHGGSALPDTPRRLRSPRAQEPRPRLGCGRGGGGCRQGCEQVPAWR